MKYSQLSKADLPEESVDLTHADEDLEDAGYPRQLKASWQGNQKLYAIGFLLQFILFAFLFVLFRRKPSDLACARQLSLYCEFAIRYIYTGTG